MSTFEELGRRIVDCIIAQEVDALLQSNEMKALGLPQQLALVQLGAVRQLKLEIARLEGRIEDLEAREITIDTRRIL